MGAAHTRKLFQKPAGAAPHPQAFSKACGRDTTPASFFKSLRVWCRAHGF